ncbi:MAG: peptidylprolyl isomerase [Bdellovibrionales bacterium]|nr:peptidylprolyl isomerase [Bdellovibrionales bacterium]
MSRFNVIVGLLVAAIAAPSFAQNANLKAPLVKVNDRVITVEEFNKRYEQNSQLMPGKAPAKADVLKNIVYFELATQEARRLGLHKDQALKEQFDILLYQAIVRRFIQPKVDGLEVSESEVRKYYEENPLIRTSHIILLSRPGMTENEVKDLRDRASKILDQVRAGKKNFEELAREYSEGPTARTGGDVDWGARHKLLPEYYDAALALKNVGDVSGLVETPYGVHIIKLTGKRPFSEIDSVYKDFIIRSLRESKGQNIYNAYFEDLKKKAHVTINDKLLK